MSDKSEEIIEKTNSTSNTVSKRTIKLPTSVTGKKKDVDSKPINNIIPIESLKEKNLSSKRTKRTLHLNLGNEPEEVNMEPANDENSITMIIPKISTIKDDKAKLLDSLLDVDDISPAITPSTVTSKKSFLDEPSVFEKFDININNKITSTSAQQNAEPTINLNSSFFYEPSVFEKYSIEISETDSNDDNVIEPQKSENIVEEKNIEKVVEEPIINQNSIDTNTSLSLNDLVSIDDETESIDDILNASVEIESKISENIEVTESDNTEITDEIPATNEDEIPVSDEIIEEKIIENIDETENLESSITQEDAELIDEIINDDIGEIIEDNSFDELINSTDIDLMNELSDENNDYNLLDLVEDDDNLLTEVADEIKTPESNAASAPVGIFIENSGVQKNNDSSLFSKAKKSIVSNITSVFKKFSYDEAANLAASIDEDDIDETTIQNVNPISDINQVLGNIEVEPQEKSVTELDVTADSIGIKVPTLEENLLDTISTENDLNSLNILTPESTTSDFSDDELLDLLEFDSSNNELIDSFKNEEFEEDYKDIENSESINSVEEISEDDEELINLLDNEINDDDFSIEDYFGIEKVEDSDIVEEDDYEEEFEENIEDLLDDDADIEFDEEVSKIQEPKVEEPQNKMSGEELLSLSKLFDNLTNTISSLSNRISELENTKMQPVIIEPEAIKQAIEQVSIKPIEIEENITDNNISENDIEYSDVNDTIAEDVEDVIEEDNIEDNIKEENIEYIKENDIEENIIQDEIEPSILEENIEDISLDDIDLEDLSGLTISDVLNENNIEKSIGEVEENIVEDISSDINLDDININDIDLTDIDLEDISLNETEQSEENTESSIEDHLTNVLSSDKNLDDQKEELLLELLSNSNNNTEENSDLNEEPASDFIKIIDSLSKAISELEQNSLENPIIPNSSDEEPVSSKDLGIDSNKAFNILINKDDIFSISILNETYEIVADFDGISVLSENIHISTPKKNFFLKVGNKNIEIHNYKKYFLVYTSFEDVEFANAINNVTFAKKNGRIELNIKEAFKLSSTNNVLELSMLNTSIAKIPSTTQSNSEPTNNDDSSVCDNKTLIISEETQKVYLPYTMADVMEKLNNTANGYQTIEEVVEKEYVVPLSDFKMPIISRFKEAYRFMRVKEKSSVYEALDLALELMFNSNLNPAIIRAAKDLKELDIYLDCLYENELDKFDRFKIIYKVLPKVQN